MSKKTEKSLIKKQTASTGNNVLYIILAALSIIFIFICLNNKFVQDDAFISFRYVQNFVDGYGLVFNIGERVEGYTNLLWVLVLSVFAFFKINLQSISQILSVLFGTLVLIMTFKVSELIELKDETKLIKKIKTSDTDTNVNYFNLIPSVMLVFTGSFIFWSISGMESTMFISFCLLGIYYYLKESSGEKS